MIEWDLFQDSKVGLHSAINLTYINNISEKKIETWLSYQMVEKTLDKNQHTFMRTTQNKLRI